MNILVTNNTFGAVGGSETYAYTLVLELKRRGFDVEALSASGEMGVTSNKLKENGIVVNYVPQKKKYDLILASHTSSRVKIIDLIGKKIQTCHGTIHPLEQPMVGMDKYVAVSEEVKNYLKEKGYVSSVINNGVDLERFKPLAPIKEKPETMLSLSQSSAMNVLLKRVCDKRGMKFISFNKFVNPVFNVEDYINQADVVVSLGRGAYESLSCGRAVMCLDNRNYIHGAPIGDGFLTEENIKDSLKFNCSGRFSKRIFVEQDILDELDKYSPSIGEFSRRFAEEHLNIKKQVDKYLNL